MPPLIVCLGGVPDTDGVYFEVIAALPLALLWRDYRNGASSERDLETTGFTVFQYGGMIGSAAGIDDHVNRGRNMDTRTPAANGSYVV